MSIADIVATRGIPSVVHFTTNRGTLGILASRLLKSRARLNQDEQLAHIFQPNARDRVKDAAWLDYVNLSISRINLSFFGYAGNWHKERDFWWCILEFSPEILSHHGVKFTTTNNIYTGVQRGEGQAGLEALFAEAVHLYTHHFARRDPGMPPFLPTCNQAEVLYPGQVSTEYLRAMHVRTPESADELAAQMSAVKHPSVDIIVSPNLFTGID
jgi:hypothetical protein